MPRLNLDISMSLDGFVAGPDQTLEEPLGAGGERLHEWAFAAQAWREAHGMDGGETNVDNEVVEEGIALLGEGVRLFDGPLPDAPRALECARVIESPTGVTHVQYRAAS